MEYKPKEKMIAGVYSAGDAVLVKDRRRAKNLLHRLNVTEYRVKKSTGNLKS
jgi:maltose O-acetyltransferase